MAVFLKKKAISKAFSTLLFLACGAFVAFRGYDCFEKYWEKPQHVEYEYTDADASSIPFPALTFCKDKFKDLSVDELTEKIQRLCKLRIF